MDEEEYQKGLNKFVENFNSLTVLYNFRSYEIRDVHELNEENDDFMRGIIEEYYNVIQNAFENDIFRPHGLITASLLNYDGVVQTVFNQPDDDDV